MSQTDQKEPERSNLDQGFATGRQALIIASQTPVADQPAKGALDFPLLTLDLKTAFGFGMANGTPSSRVHSSRESFPSLGTIAVSHPNVA